MYHCSFGSGYDKVSILIIVISPILVAIGISNVIGQQYLLPTKRQKEFTISVTIGAIINFSLNLIFIRLWKSIGASIATVIAECAVTITQIILVRKTIELKKILKIGINYLISAIVMFIVSCLIGLVIHSNKISIVLQVMCGSIVYFVILLILKDSLIFEGIKLLKQKLKRSSSKEIV